MGGRKFLAFLMLLSISISLFAQSLAISSSQDSKASIYLGSKAEIDIAKVKNATNQTEKAGAGQLQAIPQGSGQSQQAAPQKTDGKTREALPAKITYQSTKDPQAKITIGTSSSGPYIEVSSAKEADKSYISRVVEQEIKNLSQAGAIRGLSEKDISEISSLVSKGSKIVVYSGALTQESTFSQDYPPPLPSGAQEAPVSESPPPIPGEAGTPQSIVEGAAGSEQGTQSAPASQDGSSETAPAPPDSTSLSAETQEGTPAPPSIPSLSDFIKSLSGEENTIFYRMQQGGEWIGIELEPKGAESPGSPVSSPGTQDSGLETSKTQGEQFFVGMAGIFSALAIGVVIFGAGALVAYQIFLKPLPADYEIYKALSNETRVGILSELSEVEKIPTDISRSLQKSKATISEHLERLVQAGLVEKVEQAGKKFVFYRITRKGKEALRQRAG